MSTKRLAEFFDAESLGQALVDLEWGQRQRAERLLEIIRHEENNKIVLAAIDQLDKIINGVALISGMIQRQDSTAELSRADGRLSVKQSNYVIGDGGGKTHAMLKQALMLERKEDEHEGRGLDEGAESSDGFIDNEAAEDAEGVTGRSSGASEGDAYGSTRGRQLPTRLVKGGGLCEFDPAEVGARHLGEDQASDGSAQGTS